MRTYSRGFIGALLVLTIAGLLLGAVAYTLSRHQPIPDASVASGQNTTTTPTSDTAAQTYTNTKYGFTFVYAGPLFPVIDDPHGINVSLKTSNCSGLNSGGGAWPKGCETYDLFVQDNKIIAQGTDVSHSTRAVAGYSADMFVLHEGMFDNEEQVTVQFEKGGKWYIQTFTYNTVDASQARAHLDLILNSFTF